MIHQYFGNLPEPRVKRTRKHKLINIIFISLCAVICGAESWVAIENFGHVRKDWLSQFLDLSEGIPSHDTFNRVFSLIDSNAFGKQFILWAEALSERVKKVVAIDGKSMRATKDRVNNLGPLHLVNVWCCENQLVLGQEAVSNKSNEITAIPLLLELLELKGAIVTIDAMGCQKEISHCIVAKKADYVLALKGNHGNLHADVDLYIQSILDGKLKRKMHEHKTVDKGHGRFEEREYYVVKLPKGLHSEGWTGLKSIAMIRAKRTVGNETSQEDRYYISSLPADLVEDIANAIRQHWQVENSLHWRLDVSFNEDRWRAKEGNAAKNMALLNKMSLNLLKREKTSKVGIKNKRLMAAWDEKYLETVILAG